MSLDDELEMMLRRSRVDHFAAGFASRVLRRTDPAQRQLGSVLQRYFIWLVPAAVTAIAVLAIHNARASQNSHGGIDALLALQPVTLDAAYSFSAGGTAP